jgi:hypothetical protein
VEFFQQDNHAVAEDVPGYVAHGCSFSKKLKRRSILSGFHWKDIGNSGRFSLLPQTVCALEWV